MAFKSEIPTGVDYSGHGILFGTQHLFARVVVLAMAIVLTAVAMWPMQAAVLNQEGGMIETASAAGLFAAGIAALFRYPGLSRLYIGIICLLLAERELEANIYDPDSLIYLVLNGLDQVLDLTIVRVVLGVLVLGGLVWHGVPNAVRAAKLRAPFLMIFLAAGTVAVIAQLLEEVVGWYGASLSVTMATRLFVLEETLEMFFSISILAAVLIGWPKTQIEETVHDPSAEPATDTR